MLLFLILSFNENIDNADNDCNKDEEYDANAILESIRPAILDHSKYGRKDSSQNQDYHE